MFYMDEGEKVIHIIPGQGWRLVIALDPAEADEGAAEIVEEPVIAWVIVEMNTREDFSEGQKVQQLVPLIRDAHPLGRGYVWEFSQWEDVGTVLLAPGEQKNQSHDERAIKRQKDVARRRQEKYDNYDKARNLRREGRSYESIASELHISHQAARALALQVDKATKK